MNNSEVKRVPISIEDFKKLPAEKPLRAGVSNEELLAQLKTQAMTTAEVAAFLGVKNGTAYSRLKRLLQQGKVVVRYEGAKAYWAVA
jgi:transposase